MSLLDLTNRKLAWPTREHVMNPPGSGQRVLAQLAKQKIGQALARSSGGILTDVGVLAANPYADTTDAPLAIVCEFRRQASPETLREAHKLAWNFARSPLLITVDPTTVRAWTCCEAPDDGSLLEPHAAVGPRLAKSDLEEGSASDQAARAMHWVEFVSGRFFATHENRLKRDGRADRLMLANLKTVRDRLCNGAEPLDKDACHDLLARLIFVQFLFHRTDSQGNAALHAGVLSDLHGQGILSDRYDDLSAILRSHQDTYTFFEWLNTKFNGDLFAAEGHTPEERSAAWRREKHTVRATHLRTLADFVSGTLDMGPGQRCLWPQYAFDAIPLDFMSSIYEAFVRKDEEERKSAERRRPVKSATERSAGKKGVVYTPGFLVDFMLDSVLPWDSDEWDLKICDPACGSGIYLVKTYQRLIHRWRRAHNGASPGAQVLKRILTNNLFGIDVNPHAVRVASLSLYLTMCDEIEPRYYFKTVSFPTLRQERLIDADFFREDIVGCRTETDQRRYDLVVGNPPWGRNTASDMAKSWAADHGWDLTYGSVGPLFLAKAAELTKPNGTMSLLQSASILTGRTDSALRFRNRFFTEFDVQEVINLSALRFDLFEKAIGPACIVTLSPRQPVASTFSYLSPKPQRTAEDEYSIAVAQHDANAIPQRLAADDPGVWAALAWGSHRDLALIRRLAQFQSVAKLESRGTLKTREGIIRGDRQKRQSKILRRPILQEPRFPRSTWLTLDASTLPKNNDPETDAKASTDFTAFEIPQLIAKKGWQVTDSRFRAALVSSDHLREGVLCNSSYISIHEPGSAGHWLEAVCLGINSAVAVYWLLLSSGRFATYRPEIKVGEMLTVPIPEGRPHLLEGLESFEDVDSRAREAFGLKNSEWALIEDLLHYTLPDLHRPKDSPGRQPTRDIGPGRQKVGDESHLLAYCDYFARVLRAGFGSDKNVVATIFQEPHTAALPVRLVAIHLGWPEQSKPRFEQMESPALVERLLQLNEKLLTANRTEKGGIFYQRVARVYDIYQFGRRRVPTVYLVKPDQRRCWTRSMAMRDADAVAADITGVPGGSERWSAGKARGEIG